MEAVQRGGEPQEEPSGLPSNAVAGRRLAASEPSEEQQVAFPTTCAVASLSEQPSAVVHLVKAMDQAVVVPSSVVLEQHLAQDLRPEGQG